METTQKHMTMKEMQEQIMKEDRETMERDWQELMKRIPEERRPDGDTMLALKKAFEAGFSSGTVSAIKRFTGL